MAYDLLHSKNLIIEREGLNYEASLLKLQDENHLNKYKLDLISHPSADELGVLEHTDIFTWAVFKKEAKRHITIDYNNEMIVKCIFKSGILKMTATNINYIKSNDALMLDMADLKVASPIKPRSLRDAYAFRQHVETSRRNRGLDMIEEFDNFPVYY